MEKAWALFLTAALVVSVLSPLHEEYRGVRGDSFPLSWYPMFSRPRPDPDRANYVVGLEADGTRTMIRSRYYVRGGMNQARRQLGQMINTKGGAKKVCERAAKAAGKRKQGAMSRIVRIKVARGYFHMEKYFGKRDKTPVREIVYATCKVNREKKRQKGGRE